jgi:hypothetical protein
MARRCQARTLFVVLFTSLLATFRADLEIPTNSKDSNGVEGTTANKRERTVPSGQERPLHTGKIASVDSSDRPPVNHGQSGSRHPKQAWLVMPDDVDGTFQHEQSRRSMNGQHAGHEVKETFNDDVNESGASLRGWRWGNENRAHAQTSLRIIGGTKVGSSCLFLLKRPGVVEQNVLPFARISVYASFLSCGK